MNKEITYNCHYIPQFHLNYFTNEKGKLYEYLLKEKKWKQPQGKDKDNSMTTAGVAKTNGLYVYFDHKKDKYNDDIEKEFSKLESRWSDLFEEIIKEPGEKNLDSFLTSQNYELWIDFVTFSSIRTNKNFLEIKQQKIKKRYAAIEVLVKKRNINHTIEIKHKDVIKDIFPTSDLKQSEYFKINRDIFSNLKYFKISYEKKFDLDLFPIGDSCIAYKSDLDFYILPLTCRSIILISNNPQEKLKELKKKHQNEESLVCLFIGTIIANSEFSVFCANEEEYIDILAQKIHLRGDNELYKPDLKKERKKTKITTEMILDKAMISTPILNKLVNYLEDMLFINNIATAKTFLPFPFFKNTKELEKYSLNIASKKEKFNIINDCYSLFWVVQKKYAKEFRLYLLELFKNEKTEDGFLDIFLKWDSLTSDSFLIAYLSKREKFIFKNNQAKFIKKFKLVQIDKYTIKSNDFFQNEKVYNFLSEKKKFFSTRR